MRKDDDRGMRKRCQTKNRILDIPILLDSGLLPPLAKPQQHPYPPPRRQAVESVLVLLVDLVFQLP